MKGTALWKARCRRLWKAGPFSEKPSMMTDKVKRDYTAEWLRRFSLDVQMFDNMAMREVEQVYQALSLAVDVIEGVRNHPWVEAKPHRMANLGSDYLEMIRDTLSERRQALFESIGLRRLSDEDDVNRYTSIRGHFLFGSGGGGGCIADVRDFLADFESRHALLAEKSEG